MALLYCISLTQPPHGFQIYWFLLLDELRQFLRSHVAVTLWWIVLQFISNQVAPSPKNDTSNALQSPRVSFIGGGGPKSHPPDHTNSAVFPHFIVIFVFDALYKFVVCARIVLRLGLWTLGIIQRDTSEYFLQPTFVSDPWPIWGRDKIGIRIMPHGIKPRGGFICVFMS